jgi:hypothetical protein
MTTTTIHAPFGRGCGSRSSGACYLACGLSLSGNSIEHFVIDPVRRWPQEMSRKDHNRGFQLLPVPGQNYHHVVIFVGESFYASPWTFLEECRHFGASRKVPPTFPFDKIQPGKSQMYFVHPKAYADPIKHGFCLNHSEHQPLPDCKFFADDLSLWEKKDNFTAGWHPTVRKEKGISQETACTFAHKDLACIFHKEEDVSFGESTEEGFQFTIQAPSFSYTGEVPIDPNILKLSETYDKSAFLPGIFLRLPISHFESKDYAGSWAEKAQKAGFSVEVLEY